MWAEVVTYVLIGLCGLPFVFMGGFFVAKAHVRYLAKRGGEERFPDRVGRVVRRYRHEHVPERDRP